jgi:hypothetical protein
MLEVAIEAILHTCVQEAIVSSGNDGAYQSKQFIICIAALLNIKYDGLFFISGMFHHEMQDGKGLVDAHFSIAMQHLKKYMKTARQNKMILDQCSTWSFTFTCLEQWTLPLNCPAY